MSPTKRIEQNEQGPPMAGLVFNRFELLTGCGGGLFRGAGLGSGFSGEPAAFAEFGVFGGDEVEGVGGGAGIGVGGLLDQGDGNFGIDEFIGFRGGKGRGHCAFFHAGERGALGVGGRFKGELFGLLGLAGELGIGGVEPGPGAAFTLSAVDAVAGDIFTGDGAPGDDGLAVSVGDLDVGGEGRAGRRAVVFETVAKHDFRHEGIGHDDVVSGLFADHALRVKAGFGESDHAAVGGVLEHGEERVAAVGFPAVIVLLAAQHHGAPPGGGAGAIGQDAALVDVGVNIDAIGVAAVDAGVESEVFIVDEFDGAGPEIGDGEVELVTAAGAADVHGILALRVTVGGLEGLIVKAIEGPADEIGVVVLSAAPEAEEIGAEVHVDGVGEGADVGAVVAVDAAIGEPYGVGDEFGLFVKAGAGIEESGCGGDAAALVGDGPGIGAAGTFPAFPGIGDVFLGGDHGFEVFTVADGNSVGEGFGGGIITFHVGHGEGGFGAFGPVLDVPETLGNFGGEVGVVLRGGGGFVNDGGEWLEFFNAELPEIVFGDGFGEDVADLTPENAEAEAVAAGVDLIVLTAVEVVIAIFASGDSGGAGLREGDHEEAEVGLGVDDSGVVVVVDAAGEFAQAGGDAFEFIGAGGVAEGDFSAEEDIAPDAFGLFAGRGRSDIVVFTGEGIAAADAIGGVFFFRVEALGLGEFIAAFGDEVDVFGIVRDALGADAEDELGEEGTGAPAEVADIEGGGVGVGDDVFAEEGEAVFFGIRIGGLAGKVDGGGEEIANADGAGGGLDGGDSAGFVAGGEEGEFEIIAGEGDFSIGFGGGHGGERGGGVGAGEEMELFFFPGLEIDVEVDVHAGDGACGIATDVIGLIGEGGFGIRGGDDDECVGVGAFASVEEEGNADEVIFAGSADAFLDGEDAEEIEFGVWGEDVGGHFGG